jgi:hypothetical protein
MFVCECVYELAFYVLVCVCAYARARLCVCVCVLVCVTMCVCVCVCDNMLQLNTCINELFHNDTASYDRHSSTNIPW